MNIEDIIDIDDELFEQLNTPLTEMCIEIKKSKFQKTLEAIFMLQLNISFLKNGIFKNAEDENYYSINVLLRSLSELFIKHLYLFIEFCHKKDDFVGQEYYKWTDIKEYQDYFNGLKKEKALLSEAQKEFNLDEIISEVYSGYAELPNKEKKDNKYSFYKLLKYVNEKLPTKNPILTNLPTDYSIMSSFVHGGPHANRLVMFNGVNEENRKQEIYQICKKAYLFSIMSLINTFVTFGQFNHKYLSYLELIRSYLVKIED